MIVFRVGIPLSPSLRSRVIRSLQGILDQTRVLPGCISCQLCTEVENQNRLLLIEEWTDLHSLRAHLRADSFKVVLSALECASAQPELRFDTVADTRGLELITVCRGGQ